MVGRQLGHYVIMEQIGAGGMGVVYRARDQRLDRDVALKILPPGLFSDERARSRFRNEARALSKLNHPNIAIVHDFSTQDGVDFLVMEYVEGASLAEKLKGEALEESEIAFLGGQIASALEEAHERGIVHRDLKPGNIRVTPKGRLKLLDFGLAKLLVPGSDPDATRSVAETGPLVGTMPYMAPEQLRGEAIDGRTDIYSFGAVLYEMATARLPFAEGHGPRLIDSILNKQPSNPRTVRPRISLALEHMVLKCLEKDPRNRYQSVKELAVDLRRLGAPASPEDRSKFGRVLRHGWRFPTALGIVGLGIVLLLLAAGFLAKFGSFGERFRPGNGTPKIASLAVLPLQNLSGDSQQEYFADAMTEQLIADLGQISALRVTSRTSVMTYKTARKPLPEIARELNVDAVVEGSVINANGKVQINAQLIRAATDAHLWGKTYERDLADVLTLQREVARAIAREIEIQLTPAEVQRLTSDYPVNAAAYELYLKGWYFTERRTEDGFNAAEANFRRAIEIDPKYAAAYAGLAACFMFRISYGLGSTKETLPKAKDALRRAQELDPSLSEIYGTLADIAVSEWEWGEAERQYRKAISLNPNSAGDLYGFGDFLTKQGRFDEAVATMRLARERDPLSLPLRVSSGETFYYARRWDEAIAEYRKVLELDPNFWRAHGSLALAYHQKGMHTEGLREIESVMKLFPHSNARAELARSYALLGRQMDARRVLSDLQRESGKHYVDPYWLAKTYSALKDHSRALDLLEQAYQERSAWLQLLKVDPELDPLRNSTRFQSLLRAVGFVR